MTTVCKPAALVTLVCILILSTAASAAQAVSDTATSSGKDHPWVFGPPIAGIYIRPVQRAVSDPFRMQNGPYGSGNFGLEYATSPGDAVVAIGAGRVTFAGSVAGQLAVTVAHPDGRRSSLTGLSSMGVRVNQIVIRGQFLGTALRSLQLGIRQGDQYVDPALFLAVTQRRARLVPEHSSGK